MPPRGLGAALGAERGGNRAIADDPTRPDVAIPALDGFRALAILIVLGSHVGLERIVPGQFGVTLFFFLSGYLITTLLRREVTKTGRIDFRAFYRRRAVRILPPLYLTLGLFVLLSAIGWLHRLSSGGLMLDLLFLSNYFPISGMPIGLWSLAVEEHFYLLFPLSLALLLRRARFAGCAAACLALCGVVLAGRFAEVARGADPMQMMFWTHTRIDSILFGSILALWNNPVADRTNVLPRGPAGYALAAALLLPSFLIRDEAFRLTVRYTLQGLGLLVLFNAAIRDRRLAGPLLDNPVTRQVALFSYTLYLVHSGLILAFSGRGYGEHPLLPTLAALLCSFAYAWAMHRWVEEPMSRWRRARERAERNARVAEPVSAASGT